MSPGNWVPLQVTDRRKKLSIRTVISVLLIINTGFLGVGYLDRHESYQGPTERAEVGDTIAEASNGTTVIATQGTIPSVELPRDAISGPNGAIYAIGSTGELLYRNDTYHAYFDVDPVPDTRASVLYVGHEFVPKSECRTKYHCYVRHVGVLNLSTGESRSVFSSTVSGPSDGNAGRWHDVDWYDEDSILVADIVTDSIILINVSSGLIEWEWRAERAFHPSSGGDYLHDWAHINDVELLPDGRIMASLRNQDTVVFLHPQTGLQPDWSLGADENHDVLHAQHNPDYIPDSHGGPAVVVADSGNDRLVEYQRVDGGWMRSWTWEDDRMNFPRDVDRLPNGHTLVTDSFSGRVFEIDEEGEMIWSVSVDTPYEAERLETGDESKDGRSATDLDLTSRTVPERTGITAKAVIKSVIPDPVLGAILFVRPFWMGFYHIGAAIMSLGLVLIWSLLEFHWSKYRLRIRKPVMLERK